MKISGFFVLKNNVSMTYMVYILNSKKLDRFYIGFTSNLEKRLEFHHNAESQKFTYKAKDWEVYLKIECKSKGQALAIEKHIKKMKSKVYIQNLKKYSEMKIQLLERYSESSPR
jgi:putative endonuclease